MHRQLGKFGLLLCFASVAHAEETRAVSSEIVAPTLNPGARGEIKFTDVSRDFGVAKRGEKLVYDYAFENVGGGPLVIFGVHASCGCTVVESEIGKEYPIDTKGTVRVSFDTTNFRGAVSKMVTVMTNEKILPEHTLTLRANIQEELSVDPPVLDWGEVDLGATPEKTLTVKSFDATKKLAVTDLKYDKALFKAALTSVDATTWQVKVSLIDSAKSGPISSTFFVVNNSGALKELPVPTRGFVRSPYAFSPQYLEFGAIAANVPETRVLTVQQAKAVGLNFARAELRINNKPLTPIDKYLKVTPKQSAGGVQPEMAIELTNHPGLKGSVHGRMFFKPETGSSEEVSVDFYAFFQE